MSDTTQAVTSADPQAGQGQQEVTEPEQPRTGQVTQATWNQADAEAEIKALRAEAAKWRKEKQAEQKARETAEAQALTEQGNFKALFEKAQPKIADYDTLRERYDALIEQVQATNKKRIDAIPDAMKSLVPEYDDPLKVSAWLDANAAVFAKPQAPSLDGRAGGTGGGVSVTDGEVKEFAARFKLNPDFIDRAQLAKLKR